MMPTTEKARWLQTQWLNDIDKPNGTFFRKIAKFSRANSVDREGGAAVDAGIIY